MNSAIPTYYAGVRFRWRLKTTWAAFFTACGWPWQYEPLDLAGYIPDFVLPFPHGPLLVEVKPSFYLSATRAATPKIEASGWFHEALVVGGGFVVDDEEGESPRPRTPRGADSRRRVGPGGVAGVGGPRAHSVGPRPLPPEPTPPAWGWDAPRLMRCTDCHAVCLYHTVQGFHCRMRGCYDGTGQIGPVSGDLFWSQA